MIGTGNSSQNSFKRIHTAWAAQLGESVQRLTGINPESRWLGRFGRKEVQADLWWQFVHENSGTIVYVGALETSWRGLVNQVLGENRSSSFVDPKQVYVSLLKRSSGDTGTLSAQRPPCDEFDLLELQFPEGQPVRLMLGAQQDARNGSILGILSAVEAPITVRFGSSRVSLRELVALDAGSAIEVDRRIDEPVDILVNGHLVARGEAIVIRGNYGVRITEVTSTEDRLNTSRRVVSANYIGESSESRKTK